MKVDLNERSISGFVENFLLSHYDEAKAIPPFHMKWWNLACDPWPKIAIAAPRKHAKTTALNHAFGLASALFQQYPFQVKISKKWELACERIYAAAEELKTNQPLRRFFGVKRFLRDTKDDIIVECADGYKFRMYAMGMDQAIRGILWGTMRPKLILGDDMEDDKLILNPEYRAEVMQKIDRVLLPMGADNCKFIINGTILHQASALNKLLRMKGWKSGRWEACDAEVSEESILWPQKFPREKMLEIKNGFIESGDMTGFNMEYRNIAVDITTSFFRPEDFIPMSEEDWFKPKTYYVGGDLAYTKNQMSNWTVLMLAGLDSDGILHFIEERRGRWDGKQVIDQLYALEALAQELQKRNDQDSTGVQEWYIESGAIKKSLDTALQLRMPEEGYLNIAPDLTPTRDKAVRAYPLQARMRARGTRWNTKSEWFMPHQEELLEFTQEGTRGEYDDRVDADAWLGYGIKRMTAPPSEEQMEAFELRASLREAANDDMGEYDTMTAYEFLRDQA